MAPRKRDKPVSTGGKKADRDSSGSLNQKKTKSHGHGGDDDDKTKKSNWKLFAIQLASFGLTLRDAKADGNCMFRALADQLEGNQSNHAEYRKAIVDYMEDEPDDYAPFVTEDWDAYCKRMRKDGTWGGHLELNAACRCFSRHIIVHQLNAPRLEIRHPTQADVGSIHLAYHDGEHYSSVRDKDDKLFGAAREIRLHQRVGKKMATPATRVATPPPPPLTPAERIVMQTTGCTDLKAIRAVLTECWNDVDAACEIIEAEKYESQKREEEKVQREEHKMKYEQEYDSKNEQHDFDTAIAQSLGITSIPSTTNTPVSTSTSASASTSASTSTITKNDPCPCGSGKKYKSCCKQGASSSHSSSSSSHAPSASKYAKSHDYSSHSSTLDDDEKPVRGSAHLTNKQRKAIAKSEKLAHKTGKKKDKDQTEDALAEAAIHDFGSLTI